jgi:hypothetical protein
MPLLEHIICCCIRIPQLISGEGTRQTILRNGIILQRRHLHILMILCIYTTVQCTAQYNVDHLAGDEYTGSAILTVCTPIPELGY